MKVYHSSTLEIQRPEVSFSRQFLDFGPGFYVTTLQDQAEKYGERFKLRGKIAILNEYDLSDDLSAWNLRKFAGYDEEWLDYVGECRAGRIPDHSDIVKGGIANDKVFRTLDLYFAGDISKEDALRKLVFERPNNQICLRSQELIDQCLTFISSRQL